MQGEGSGTGEAEGFGQSLIIEPSRVRSVGPVKTGPDFFIMLKLKV